MRIEISKTDYTNLLDLATKASNIIKGTQCSNREYNVARRLQLTVNAIIRKEQKRNGKD